MKILLLLTFLVGFLPMRSFGAEAEAVRIVGSSHIARPMSLAVPILNDRGVIAKVAAEAGSTAAIEDVGSGNADIALTVRKLSGSDRAPFPSRVFHEEVIGYQALALVVPADVWESGVHTITREQVRRIYENEVKNWKELGGEDREIKFLNPEEGDGVWEFFATWLYGEINKAPLGSNFQTVKGGADTRDVVEFTNGSISVLPEPYADNKHVYALAVQGEKGPPTEATLQNIYERRYPIQRPLMLVTGDSPSGNIRKVFEFMVSPEGQELVKKSDFIPLPPR